MSTVAGAWMGLQLPSPTVITKCRIKTYNPTLPSYSPSELLLIASSDGTTWVELSTIIDPFNDTPNGPYIHKTYSFINTVAYVYYRLVFVRGSGYGRPVISCFYVADDANANHPPGYLSSSTANGYTLTSSYDLLVRSASFGQQFGESWHPTTTYITNNTLEDEVNYVGGNNYSGTFPYLYANVPQTTTSYTGNAFGAWIQYQLPSSTVITKYRIVPYPDSTYSVRNFTFLGSTNGTTWTILDRNNINTPSLSGPGLHKTFNITNTVSYTYYRLVFIRSNQNPFAIISGFYLSDSSGTNYPSGLLASPTSNGYTLTQSSDLYVARNGSAQSPGSSWYVSTTNIADVNVIDSRQEVGSTNCQPSNYFYYSGTTTTSYTIAGSLPTTPTSLSSSAGNQSAVIAFTPGDSGSSPITNYKYSIDNGATYTAFSPVITTSPVVITGLTNGQAYSIKLLAVNIEGDGTPSATITVTPHSVPDAPTNLVATYGAPGSVSISFTPGSNGGETITNYLYSIDCGVSFTALSPVDGTSPITISGLTIGQSYCIELIASNVLGAGVASSSVQYTATGLPAAPTSITWADLKNGSIAVSFVPGSDAASSILNYQYSLDGGNTFTTLSPADAVSPITISGLSERVNYVLVLRAVNTNGEGTASAPVYLRYMCFLEGTKILCFDPETQQEVERPIETLRKGTLVKTTYSGYKAVDTIGTSKIYNPANSMRSLNRLYKCSKENYPELKEDLFITGCHSILVQELTEEERALSLELQGKIYATDRLYRLIAAADKRAEPYASEGVFNIWHLALENENYYFNYGIYANGLLVETTSLRMIKEKSGMDLVQ